MKTILLNIHRFSEGRDGLVTMVFRGTDWKINDLGKEYAVLDVFNQGVLLGSFKQWESIYFSDDLVKESFI